MNYKKHERNNIEKQYLKKSVYDASKERIKEVLPNYDNILISFTGGKDCTVVLYLVEECMKELGINKKINIVYDDIEISPIETVQYIERLKKNNNYNFIHLCLPHKEEIQILNEKKKFIFWDIKRKNEWYRLPPDDAITTLDGKNVLINNMNLSNKIYIASKFLKGSICVFLGHRADESTLQYRSIMSNEKPYIIKYTDRIDKCKPIYDWNSKDVFLYLYKNKKDYNKLYDNLVWCGLPLRSDLKISDEGLKNINIYKQYDSDFYNNVIKILPNIEVNSRYLNDLSFEKITSKYSHDVNGIVKYIKDNFDKDNQKKELKKFKLLYRNRKNLEKQGYIMGDLPYRKYFNHLIYGNSCDIGKVQSHILDDFLFEGYTEDDYKKYKERFK